MDEILPGVFHWTTFHEDIGEDVHSYCVAASPAFAIDPRVPGEGLAWFGRHAVPKNIYLTNRLHYRHSHRFAQTFGATVWCHDAGLHHFPASRLVRGFRHGATLPGGVQALEIGALCPEETAMYIPMHGGIVAFGDALIRPDGALAFVEDELMGDDPAEVKRGLRASFSALMSREFDTALFAHGEPWVRHAKAALAGFLALEDQS